MNACVYPLAVYLYYSHNVIREFWQQSGVASYNFFHLLRFCASRRVTWYSTPMITYLLQIDVRFINSIVNKPMWPLPRTLVESS